jgi:hypothetical protein
MAVLTTSPSGRIELRVHRDAWVLDIDGAYIARGDTGEAFIALIEQLKLEDQLDRQVLDELDAFAREWRARHGR